MSINLFITPIGDYSPEGKSAHYAASLPHF